MTKSGQKQPDSAPHCAPPDSELRAPARPMAAQSCDCHAHVCGPEARFPYAAERIYTPPDALPDTYLALLRTLGVTRAVLVQPSVYGTDNAAMLAGMRTLQAAGLTSRGVAVVDAGVGEAELDALHAAGVRGLRFNLVDLADPRVGPPLAAIRQLCERIAPRFWHAEFLIHVDDYPDFEARFGDFPTDIVVGHMGYLRPGRDADDKGFRGMLRLAEAGRCWVKLTAPYRISAGDLPYPEAAAFARAIVAAAPHRAVWGTDWPHVMVKKAMPNDADLCDLLPGWVPDAALRRRILVDNAAELYGF